MKLVDPRTGKNIGEIARPKRTVADDDHRGGYWTVTFSPDGKRLILVMGYGAVVVDIATGKELGRLEGHAVHLSDAKVSADGKRIATLDLAGLVRLWDATTLRPLNHPTGHTAPVTHAEISTDGKRLLTLADDDTLRVWDMSTGKELRAFGGVPWSSPVESNAPQKPTFTPNGLSVVFGTKTKLVARDILTGQEVPLPNDHSEVQLASATLNAEKRTPGRQFAKLRDLAPSQIRLCESATEEVRRTFASPLGSATVLGFTPDGTRLLTAGADHTVLVWDVRLQAMPLTDDIKKETSAPKLWATMCTGKADEAYLAMARLAVEPPVAVKMAGLRLKPAVWGVEETVATRLADARAIELLESLGTVEAKALVAELAAGHFMVWRTQEAKRALERMR